MLGPIDRIRRALKQRRLDLGMTQEQVAYRLEMHRSQIAQWEQGWCTPTLESLILWTRALRWKVEELAAEART